MIVLSKWGKMTNEYECRSIFDINCKKKLKKKKLSAQYMANIGCF